MVHFVINHPEYKDPFKGIAGYKAGDVGKELIKV